MFFANGTMASVRAAARKTSIGWFPFALAAIPMFVGLLALTVSDSNYILFDSPDTEVTVKVDGFEISALHSRMHKAGPNVVGTFGRVVLVAKVGPGKHALEIFDAAGKVLESAEVNVPTSGYRAIYSVGGARRYSLVSVAYGQSLDAPEQVELIPGPVPHLSLFPSAPKTYENDFTVNREFPKKIRSEEGVVLRGLCTVSEESDVDCAFETPATR
ncbi:hypothetical protein LVJ94_01880 [Pendulispora rubella]|uniref:Uncharacterized protein n=1 Tax=Pendulispora rubella TaxID=2741070 RepID=A0ABZ2L7V1_9BACT